MTGTLLTSAACDILNTPVSSPEILFIIISSSLLGVVARVLLAIKVLLIAVLNVLVVPPTCPSNVIWFELTSPVSWKVDALVNLFAFVEPPVTVPVMLPIKLPLNSTACTADQRLSLVPKEYCCVAIGVIAPTVLDPATLKSVPTNNFFAIPTPPLILTAPVPILALSVVPCTIKFALV